VKDLYKLLKRGGRIIILESIAQEWEEYSDFIKPRTIDYWINLFHKEGLMLTSCRGADPHVIPDLIRKFKQRIKHEKSLERLYIRVNERPFSKQYNMLISLSFLLSLPLDLCLRKITHMLSHHCLMIFRK
jgi:hypothetical protein